MSKLPTCDGCENDFYNGSNPYGIKKCWSRGEAKAVTRYRIHRDTLPGAPRAFTEVRVWSCRFEKGFALYTGLPDFVKAKDVVRREATQ